MKSSTMTPLLEFPIGQRARVASLDGGCNCASRLRSMGVTVGSELELVKRNNWGPVLIAVGGTRLAIGRGMARQIHVTPLQQD
ncbi:MAG: FeoA family protein [Planctomycetota bacterium]